MPATTSTSPSLLPANASGSLAARVRKPSGTITYIGACIYGRIGAGKTRLLGSMPGRGLVLDVPQVEGGTMVLEDKKESIDVLPIVKWEELEEAFQLLKANVEVPGTEFRGSYQWVALDSATALGELAKRKAIRERPEGLAADPHIIGLQDWGKVGQLMAEMFFKFRTLRMHVLFTAQERIRTDDNGTMIAPDVSPAALAAMLPSMFLVARLFVKEVPSENGAYTWQRQLNVGPSSSVYCKVRALPSRPLPTVIAEPSLAEIFGYILGKRKEAPKAAAVEEVLEMTM